jgi:CheY-like chemotaxis protein
MKKKILLVDDSKTVRMMERMLLEDEPYELVEAADGEEAVERALAERPDLILMDVVMPNMTGFEACRKLRSMPETSATPVIFVTTRSEAENFEEGYLSGGTDYVTKPIDGVELLEKVRLFLGEGAS